jgi:hypothetical protein
VQKLPAIHHFIITQNYIYTCVHFASQIYARYVHVISTNASTAITTRHGAFFVTRVHSAVFPFCFLVFGDNRRALRARLEKVSQIVVLDDEFWQKKFLIQHTAFFVVVDFL